MSGVCCLRVFVALAVQRGYASWRRWSSIGLSGGVSPCARRRRVGESAALDASLSRARHLVPTTPLSCLVLTLSRRRGHQPARQPRSRAHHSPLIACHTRTVPRRRADQPQDVRSGASRAQDGPRGQARAQARRNAGSCAHRWTIVAPTTRRCTAGAYRDALVGHGAPRRRRPDGGARGDASTWTQPKQKAT